MTSVPGCFFNIICYQYYQFSFVTTILFRFVLASWLIIGDSGDGSVVGTEFWTLPAPETPLTISALHVVPGKTFLDLNWRGLPCMSSYVVRICEAGSLQTCQHTLVNKKNNRSVHRSKVYYYR